MRLIAKQLDMRMKKMTLILSAASVSLTWAQTSLLPPGKSFKLVWHDEFDGDRLDESKWSYRTNFWGSQAHWFATPEDNAVEVKDGFLHLKLVKRLVVLRAGEKSGEVALRVAGEGLPTAAVKLVLGR